MESYVQIYPRLSRNDDEDSPTYPESTPAGTIEVYNPFSPAPSVASSYMRKAVIPWQLNMTVLSSRASTVSPYPIPLSRLQLPVGQTISSVVQRFCDIRKHSSHTGILMQTAPSVASSFEQQVYEFEEFTRLRGQWGPCDESRSWHVATDIIENCWQCLYDHKHNGAAAGTMGILAYNNAINALNDQFLEPSLTSMLVLHVLLSSFLDIDYEEHVAFTRHDFIDMFLSSLPVQARFIRATAQSASSALRQTRRQHILRFQKVLLEHIEMQRGSSSSIVLLLKVRLCADQVRPGEVEVASTMLEDILPLIEARFYGLTDDAYEKQEITFYLGQHCVARGDMLDARGFFFRSLKKSDEGRPITLWRKLDTTLNLAYCNALLKKVVVAELWLHEALQLRHHMHIRYPNYWRMGGTDLDLTKQRKAIERNY